MKVPSKPPASVRPDLLEEILAVVENPRKKEVLAELIRTVVGLGEDDADMGDLKLFRKAMAEMRYATRVFSKFRDFRKVAVFGSARTKPEMAEYQLASEFAQKMVAENYMIITGGGDGIMGAAQAGAGAAKSFGLNILLPFEQRANVTIHGDPKLINFNYFFTRKLNFLKETHALVLLPGGFGTQDEGFESLTLMQTGKSQIVPVILLDKVNGYYWETWRRFVDNDLLGAGLVSPSDFHFFEIANSADEAVRAIKKFYHVFHSYRWVREKLVIRIERRLQPQALDALNEKFQHILASGRIEQSSALREERDNVALLAKPRLVLTPEKRDFGRLRLLINEINSSATEESTGADPAK